MKRLLQLSASILLLAAMLLGGCASENEPSITEPIAVTTLSQEFSPTAGAFAPGEALCVSLDQQTTYTNETNREPVFVGFAGIELTW